MNEILVGISYCKVPEKIKKVVTKALMFLPKGNSNEYEHFFDDEKMMFPRGFLTRVCKALEDREIDYCLKTAKGGDYKPRNFGTVRVDDLIGRDLRDYQVESCNALLKEGGGRLEAGTGAGKGTIICSLAQKFVSELDYRVLILVPKIGLLNQTAEEVQKLLGDEISVGRLGGGKKELSAQITVSTFQSLSKALPETYKYVGTRRKVVRKNDPNLTELLDSIGALIVDEAHHARGGVYYDLIMRSKAQFKCGVSATFDTGIELDNAYIEGGLGDVKKEIPTDYLVKMGWLAKPTVHFITDPSRFGPNVVVKKFRRPNKSIDGIKMHQVSEKLGIMQNEQLNKAIAELSSVLIEIGKPPLILTPKMEHISNIEKEFEELGVEFRTLTGEDPVEVRNRVKEEFVELGTFALIASTIFDEGEDVPLIRAVILAGGGKTPIATPQRIGRGIRKKEEDNTLLVYDFGHLSVKMLRDHAMERLKIYRKKKFLVKNVVNLKAHIDELESVYKKKSS